MPLGLKAENVKRHKSLCFLGGDIEKILISCDILLMAYDVDFIIMLYVVITPIMGFMICLIIEYNIKKAFYQKLNNQIEELDEKYLISEIIEKPDFKEGKILVDTLRTNG